MKKLVFILLMTLFTFKAYSWAYIGYKVSEVKEFLVTEGDLYYGNTDSLNYLQLVQDNSTTLYYFNRDSIVYMTVTIMKDLDEVIEYKKYFDSKAKKMSGTYWLYYDEGENTFYKIEFNNLKNEDGTFIYFFAIKPE